MNANSRAAGLAMALFGGAWLPLPSSLAAAAAQFETSPLFAAPGTAARPANPDLIPPPLVTASSPISARLRREIAGAVVGQSTLSPTQVPDVLVAAAADTEAIVMARYVVRSQPSLAELPPPTRRFVEIVRTGTLMRHVGRHVTSELNTLGQPGPGGYGRMTLGFSFSW